MRRSPFEEIRHTFSGRSTAKKRIFEPAPFLFILFITLVVRLYKIETPLWLDEIYGYRLAKLGFEAIIQNSWVDPHPPLYYLIQWVVSGFGYARSEIAWRWLPLVSGVFTIFLMKYIAEVVADSRSSIVICLIGAMLPSLVFYSQEARPFSFMILLASLSIWLILRILDSDLHKGKLWAAWTIVSLFGLHTGYAYSMIVGVQIVFLGFFYYRHLEWWLASLAIGGGSLPIVPFAISSLTRVASHHSNSVPLTLWRTLQTLLAGEPLRYGFLPSHVVLPWFLIGLSILSGVRSIRLRSVKLVYFIAQSVLPMSVFFALSSLLNIRLPLPEAKQFIVLMPAFLALMAGGIAEIRDKLNSKAGFLIIATICALTVCLNIIGLLSYWKYPKSPEGVAVLRLVQEIQPNEMVVSLHHSLTYALGFYTRGIPVCLPKKDGEMYKYWLTDSEQIFSLPIEPSDQKRPEEIRSQGAFWVVAHTTLYREPIEPLISGCQLVKREIISALHGSFEIMKVDCSMPIKKR